MIIDLTSVISGLIVAVAAVIAIRLTINSKKSDRSKWEGSVEARLVHLDKNMEKIDFKIDGSSTFSVGLPILIAYWI